MYHVTPPDLLDVVLHLHTQGAVVVKAVEAVVDLRGLEHETAALAHRHDVLHVEREVGVQNDALSSQGGAPRM